MKNLKNFCVIDVETKGLSARPEAFVFGCMYAENFKKVFHDREEMKKFLLSSHNPYKYIFAHNGEFDFTCLFDNIILNLDNSALFVGSAFIQAKSCGKIFSNSLTILKSSVKELGKNLGLEKLELDNKFKEGDESIKVTEQDIEYCFRDCEIVFHFLTKMFSLTNKIKPTVASCAMEIFSKEFLNRKFIKSKYNEIFRNSYYGGRVECFRFGKIKPIYKYDVNSLYPAVCTKMFFPDFNKIKKGKKILPSFFKTYILNNYEGCAKLTIEHKNNFIGVLPYRKQNEIIFPVGIFTQYWNFNELRIALKTGLIEIKKVHEYYYSQRIRFTELREYMLHYYNAKNNSTGAEKLLNKFLLNALTGKFAQKEYGQKIYFETQKEAFHYIKKLNNNIKISLHHFNEDREDLFIEVFDKKRTEKTTWNIPTISSYITSEARCLMLPLLIKYQKNICYTDTDSLVLDCPLDKKYISETTLGMFKEEHEKEIEIIGNKHYKTKIGKEKIHHIKGVSKNYKQKGQNFTFKKMIKTKESINRNLHAGLFVDIVKHIGNDYTKREVTKNNKTKSLKLVEL